MPIYQVNIWVCEVCNKTVSTAEETSPYSDPVIVPPNDEEWDYVGDHPDEKLACPNCVRAKNQFGCSTFSRS